MKSFCIAIWVLTTFTRVFGDGTVHITIRGLLCPAEAGAATICSRCSPSCRFRFKIVAPSENDGGNWTQSKLLRERFSTHQVSPNELEFGRKVFTVSFKGSWLSHYPIEIQEHISGQPRIPARVYHGVLGSVMKPEGSFLSTMHLQGPNSTRLTLDVQVACSPNFYKNCSTPCFDEIPQCCDAEGRLQCCEDFYGEDCHTFCEERDDSDGHYQCDPHGQKLCLPGWSGPNCRQPSRAVVQMAAGRSCDLDCQNGGSCVAATDNVSCFCAKGFLGAACELDLDECEEAARDTPPRIMCFNDGVCFNTHGSYECVCPAFVTGQYCESSTTRSKNAFQDANVLCTYAFLLFAGAIMLLYNVLIGTTFLNLRTFVKEHALLLWTYRWEAKAREARRKEEKEAVQNFQREFDLRAKKLAAKKKKRRKKGKKLKAALAGKVLTSTLKGQRGGIDRADSMQADFFKLFDEFEEEDAKIEKSISSRKRLTLKRVVTPEQRTSELGLQLSPTKSFNSDSSGVGLMKMAKAKKKHKKLMTEVSLKDVTSKRKSKKRRKGKKSDKSKSRRSEFKSMHEST